MAKAPTRVVVQEIVEKPKRRGVSLAAKMAKERSKNTMYAAGTGLALGLAEKNGMFGKKGTIMGMPPAAAVGAGALIIGIATNNPMAQHVASGALAVAAHDLAKGGWANVGGDADELGADDDLDALEGDDVEVVEG